LGKTLINGRTNISWVHARVEPGSIHHTSKLMVLAIRLERLVAQGEIRGYLNIACPGLIIRRITRIMNLLNLSPDSRHSGLEHAIATMDKN